MEAEIANVASLSGSGLANEDIGSSDPAFLPTVTGIFCGKDNCVFGTDGQSGRQGFKDRLTSERGTDGQPV